MARRWAARNSAETSGSAARVFSRSQVSKSLWLSCFIFLPFAKVQIVQLLPKLFRGTKQMYLHRSNIQVENLSDFRQAPIFIMPQCKRRTLPEAEPSDGSCDP